MYHSIDLKQFQEDHKNTQRLAKGISEIEGLLIDNEYIKTNIIYFNIKKGKSRCDELAKQTQNIDIYPFEVSLNNIHFFESRPDWFRLVTHYGINREDIDKTLEVLKRMVN